MVVFRQAVYFCLVVLTLAEQKENPFSSVVRHTLISTARSCMTRMNATEADLEHLREDPPFPEKAACIIECLLEKEHIRAVKNRDIHKSAIAEHLLESGSNHWIELHNPQVGVVKNKKYSKTGFMMAISPLVFTNKKKMEHMKSVSENCEKEINHHNVELCQLGNEVTTCIFKYAPELHLKA